MKYILLFACIVLFSCSNRYYNYKFRLDEPKPTKPLYYGNDTLAISFIFSSQKLDFTLRNGKRASVGTLDLFFSGGFALPAAFELLVAETECHV